MTLFAESGMVDHWMGFTRGSLAKYMERGSRTFRFKSPIDMLGKMGLPVPTGKDDPDRDTKMVMLKEHTPLIADGVRLFEIYYDFAESYLRWHYENEQTMLKDKEFEAYWNDLNNLRRYDSKRANMDGGKGYSYFPDEYSNFKNIDFKKAATHFAHLMFYVTGYHRVIGNCADYLESGARGIALVIRESFSEAAVADYIGVNTLFGFTGFPQINLINDWSHVFTHQGNNDLKKILEDWQNDLVLLGETIEEETKTVRLKSGKPVQLSMDPRFLDSSIAI
jgi:hypothetical protein